MIDILKLVLFLEVFVCVLVILFFLSLAILVNVWNFQANPLKLYLNCIRNTLEAAMCLQVGVKGVLI